MPFFLVITLLFLISFTNYFAYADEPEEFLINSTIIVINEPDPYVIALGQGYKEFGATCIFPSGDTLYVTIDTSNIDLENAGTYVTVYSCVEPGGVIVTKTRTVQVVDLNPGFTITNLLDTNEETFNFNYPGGITTDSNDRIIVADGMYKSVNIFDVFGVFLTSFSVINPDVTYDEYGKIYQPFGVAVDSSDNIFVVEHRIGIVQVFDSTGSFITSFDGSDGDGTAFDKPKGIAIDSNDRVIVSDYAAGIVQVYETDGEFITSFDGSDGDGTQFNMPYGVAVDSNDRIIVSDESLRIVQVFDSDGIFDFIFDGSDGILFHQPIGVAVDSNDNIIVLDVYEDTVQIFGSTGSYIDDFPLGTISNPTFSLSIAIASDDRIIVGDTWYDTTVIFKGTNVIPILKLVGTNPYTIQLNDKYDEFGTICFDEINGYIPHRVEITETNVNTKVIGTYEVVYTCTDFDDNVATKIRTVIVYPSERNNGSDNVYLLKPTFGLSHSTYQPLVETGFEFNGQSFDITNNWHTPFDLQNVTLGEINSFSAKVYTIEPLRLQEFLFGIPEVGESYDAELVVTVWYNVTGGITETKITQKTDIVDPESLSVSHTKVKCMESSANDTCDVTIISMKFLEPLKDDVMAIKAVDFRRLSLITYLNDGFNISGESLNPMLTVMIPSTEKNEGLIEVTQITKYNTIWITQDGREFERNNFGSFTQINQSFERHMDTGMMKNRSHSAFSSYIKIQSDLGQSVMDEICPRCNDQSFEEINNIFAYEYPN